MSYHGLCTVRGRRGRQAHVRPRAFQGECVIIGSFSFFAAYHSRVSVSRWLLHSLLRVCVYRCRARVGIRIVYENATPMMHAIDAIDRPFFPFLEVVSSVKSRRIFSKPFILIVTRIFVLKNKYSSRRNGPSESGVREGRETKPRQLGGRKISIHSSQSGWQSRETIGLVAYLGIARNPAPCRSNRARIIFRSARLAERLFLAKS